VLAAASLPRGYLAAWSKFKAWLFESTGLTSSKPAENSFVSSEAEVSTVTCVRVAAETSVMRVACLLSRSAELLKLLLCF
jgi:hypothetical protein